MASLIRWGNRSSSAWCIALLVGIAPHARAIDARDVALESASAGPDIVYQMLSSVAQFTPFGGIRGYAMNSQACNIGNADLAWISNGTPGLAMNAYRLHDGRLEQIGMSWVKTATSATALGGCGLACNGNQGAVLGAGCMDIYSANFNGSQGKFLHRSRANAFTGVLGFVAPFDGGGNDRRLLIPEADLNPALFPGAQYFLEAHYVSTDDAAAGNAMNNTSYRRVTLNGSYDFVMNGPMQTSRSAINAWFDHGNGFGVPDPTVVITPVDVSGEGRFRVAAKVTDLGGGVWRYDYAIANHNSDRGCGSVLVPLQPGTDVTNVGFNDVDYHSGEIYDNTDWTHATTPTAVTWSSPQTHAVNPNSNALRWGTMYNYRIEANAAPAPGQLTIGMFKPGMPESVSVAAMGPGTPPPAIPTSGAWGMMVLVLSLLTAGTLRFRRTMQRA